jgi:hypothetical protein
MEIKHIEEMINYIRAEYGAKIDKLKNDMEIAIAALSNVEKTLFSNEPTYPDTRMESIDTTTSPIRRRTDIEKQNRVQVPGPTARIRSALKKTDDNFTTVQLLEIVNRDGFPIMERNTFAPAFSDIRRRKEVEAVVKPLGKQPGIYKRLDKGNHQITIIDDNKQPTP